MTIQRFLKKPMITFFKGFIFLVLVSIVLCSITFYDVSTNSTTSLTLEPTTSIILIIILFSIAIAAIIQIVFKRQVEFVAQKLTDELLS